MPYPALMLSVALFTLSVTAAESEYPQPTVDMTLQRISEHVYSVHGKAGTATDNEGFISNAAALITDEGIVVIDTLGSPSLANRFLELIRTVSDAPITKLILTHYHADHIYGAQVFKDLGAEVIAPEGSRQYLYSENAIKRLQERRISLFPFVDDNTRLIAPDRIIAQDEVIRFGALELDIKYFGSAHSDGDLAVLVRGDNVLVSGDIIFEGRVPFTGNADTKNWLRVLEELDTVELEALIPGHGPAASDPRSAISLTLEYLRYVREVMSAAVEEMIPFAEAYESADWSGFSKLPAFGAAHRTNAYGVYLSLEAEQFQ